MKKALSVTSSLALIGLLGTPLAAATSTGYDILNADPSGTGGWSHTYDGTITAAATPGKFNYTGGTGTLADGIVPNSFGNNQLFLPDFSEISITFYFDDFYTFSALTIFGGDSFGNNIPGNITGFDVEIGGTTASISTTGFGGTSSDADLRNDLADLIGTGLENAAANSITISKFTSSGQGFNGINIGEFTARGVVAPVPLPASLPLLIGGIGGLMALRRRKKS